MRRFIIILFIILCMISSVAAIRVQGIRVQGISVEVIRAEGIRVDDKYLSWFLLQDMKYLSGAYGDSISSLFPVKQEGLTPMEALDQVKERYAANFEKVFLGISEEYYYKLPIADYYLVYEGYEEDGNYYLLHLYEFVLDEPETGTGHTVTYGWYKVDKKSGLIIEQIISQLPNYNMIEVHFPPEKRL